MAETSGEAPKFDGVLDLLVKVRRRAWRERHRVTGSALGRERRYVRRGIRAYRRSVSSGTDAYLLRRNIHRLEKGLTMRPVRTQFATDYIAATVEAFRGGVSSGLLDTADPEFSWMYSVLSRYFGATAASDHPAIVRSRSLFSEGLSDIDPGPTDSGPHPAVPLVPTVKIDDLEALAAGRRSVRWFTSEQVSRDLVDRAVAIGAESPTACNRQPYRFEIFDDPVSTAKVAAVPMGTDGYDHQIPGLIVIIGNLAAFFDQRDRHLIYIDGCLAAMGLIYALEAQGVNSCCINWPDLPDREADMRALLGLERHERVVMLIAYGYADPDALVPYSAKRRVDDIREVPDTVIVDIRGTNTRNKGAQLMLEAICMRLGDRFDLSLPPAATDYTVRARLGLRQTLYEPMLPRMSSTLSNVIPARVKRDYGLTSDREIGGVLDASGFHYTDQFDVSLPKREALVGRAWARRGIPKIMLPQAFGPFERADTRAWTREALQQAHLVFVRDGVSESYVRQLAITTPTHRSPDFTIGLKPPTIDLVCEQPFLALVPNTKLFTHGDLGRAAYLELLSGFSAAARANGLASVVVVHEETDHDIARRLADRINAPLFSDADPLVLKAALGQAAAAVASRFHAVVGCLSQSVPTLAFGWSHKYRELLDDFGVRERLVTPESDPATVFTELLSDSAGDTRQKERLPELVEKVDSMWERTVEVLTAG